MRRSATAADAASGAIPVAAAEFAAFFKELGPFEPAPWLAVAVSGGADSMALLLLADAWARACGGRITGLTVDHGLRAGSAAEAAQVALWLAGRGIAHETLRWHGPYPAGDIQAAARTARYRLLGEWCHRHGVLHLLTAHHREDQAETLLLRLGRGSGLAGLAGMAAIHDHAQFRVLRPLLGVPAARLRATLDAAGQGWLEDPSNVNPDFARARLRAARRPLAALGLDAKRLAAAAAHLGRARAALERLTDGLLAETAMLDPSGAAILDPGIFSAAPEEIRLRALSAVLATVGGAVYPPRFDSLERLARALETGAVGRGRTLTGCRIVPARGRWLIHREARNLAPPVPLPPGVETLWDGRFLATWHPPPGDLSQVCLGALNNATEAARRAIVPAPGAPHVPRRIWPSLPGLWQDGTLIAVPHLGWWRSGGPEWVTIRFRPHRPLSGAGFAAVRSEGHEQ